MRIDYRVLVTGLADSASAAGMVSAFGVLANMGVKFVIGLFCVAWRYFAAKVRLKRLLPEDLARQADRVPEFSPVIGVAHVVEGN